MTLYLFLLAIGVTMLVADTPWLIEIGIVLSSWSATFVFIMMFRRIYPNTKFLVFLKSLFKKKSTPFSYSSDHWNSKYFIYRRSSKCVSNMGCTDL